MTSDRKQGREGKGKEKKKENDTSKTQSRLSAGGSRVVVVAVPFINHMIFMTCPSVLLVTQPRLISILVFKPKKKMDKLY